MLLLAPVCEDLIDLLLAHLVTALLTMVPDLFSPILGEAETNRLLQLARH